MSNVNSNMLVAKIYYEYEGVLKGFCPDNADVIAHCLSNVIKRVVEDSDEEALSEEDLNYVIKWSVETLFVSFKRCPESNRNLILERVLARYKEVIIKDLGGQQTPCIVDGTHAALTTARSIDVKGIRENLMKISEGFDGLFNCLIYKMKTLFSRSKS